MDKILPNLIDSSRTRRQVVRQLIVMDLVTNSKQLKKGISGRVTWTEDSVEQLRNLYEQHRDDQGQLSCMDRQTDRQTENGLTTVRFMVYVLINRK